MGRGGAVMIQLEERSVELDGKRYVLRCNMAVLEAVESQHNDDFEAVMQLPTRQAATEFFTAMLNDYADEQGWNIHWTPALVKRKVSWSMLQQLDVIGMLFRSVSVPGVIQGTAPAAADAEKPENSGN